MVYFLCGSAKFDDVPLNLGAQLQSVDQNVLDEVMPGQECLDGWLQQ